MVRRRLLALASLALAASPMSVVRAAVPEGPSGPVVLRVSGRSGRPNSTGAAAFDMPMLERLPQRTIVTHTPWYAQPRSFTGPLLRDVLAAAGVQGTGLKLRAVALNDYTVEIPADDAQRWDVVMARLLDDRPMTVREKGPLFIMYPFDDHAALRNSVYYSRCAWQLKALEVV